MIACNALKKIKFPVHKCGTFSELPSKYHELRQPLSRATLKLFEHPNRHPACAAYLTNISQI